MSNVVKPAMSKAALAEDDGVFDLAEIVAEAAVEHPAIKFRTEDGQLFSVPPPELWPDAALDINAGPTATAAALMGADEFARFVAAGGSATKLNLIIKAWAKKQGINLGKLLASASS